MTFIEHSLPPGDRDDELPFTTGGSPDTSNTIAEREPEPAPLVPGLDLHIPRIEQALDNAALALADLKAARARGDWPTLQASALRLKTITNHVAKAVDAARAHERQLQPTKE